MKEGLFSVVSRICDSLHWPVADCTSSGTVSSVLLLMLVLSAESLTGKQLRSLCQWWFSSRLNFHRWGRRSRWSGSQYIVFTCWFFCFSCDHKFYYHSAAVQVIQSPNFKYSHFKSKFLKIGLKSDLSPSLGLESYNFDRCAQIHQLEK